MPLPQAIIPRSFERIAHWWKHLPLRTQDRYASLGPLFAVMLFLAALSAAIVYFRYEEISRGDESLRRDMEFAQQRLRQRFTDRQDNLQALARDLAAQQAGMTETALRMEALIDEFDDFQMLTWLDANQQIRLNLGAASLTESAFLKRTQALVSTPVGPDVALAYAVKQIIYAPPQWFDKDDASIKLVLPITRRGMVLGALVAHLSLESMLRASITNEIAGRYAVSLQDLGGRVLAGRVHAEPRSLRKDIFWGPAPYDSIAVPPVGNSLLLHAHAYRTYNDSASQIFFWLVGGLSLLTVWMLVLNWRYNVSRYRTQVALQNETHFRRAMENSMLTGMRALDSQGRITYVNPAFCSMTGWSEQELLGCTAPFPYWPKADYTVLSERLKDEISGQSTPGGFEVRVQRKDGTLFDARMYVSPLIDPNGVQSGWMTSMTDITEPKRVREELSSSYERFTTVLDSLDVALSVTPLGSNELLFANKAYQQWFGMNGAGHRFLIDRASQSHMPATDDGDADDPLMGLPTDTIINSASENAEIYLAQLDRWIEVRTRYLTWVDGRLAQLVISSDITARRLAEAQAAAQAEKAEAASRLITMGEMASSVAHELNQPLTAIANYSRGMVTRIQKQQVTPEDLLPALEKTAQQAQRAGQIIQRIRSFVKRSEPNRAPSDVTVMISNAMELADIELRRHQVKLNCHVGNALPAINVDRLLIEQVLINLVKNAGESVHTANRGLTERWVDVHAVQADLDNKLGVSFIITDSGTGIPEDVLPKIYEAFYSTKSEGMGIGLKLCRSIVEAHHGRLSVRNLYNAGNIAGCEFTVWLPIH